MLEPRGNGDTLELACSFAPRTGDVSLPPFDVIDAETRGHWNTFWSSGGAIDLYWSQPPFRVRTGLGKSRPAHLVGLEVTLPPGASRDPATQATR